MLYKGIWVFCLICYNCKIRYVHMDVESVGKRDEFGSESVVVR